MSESDEWQTVGKALRELHRLLVDIARREYEKTHLTEFAPGELLQQLTSNPAFAWLRELSELIVDLDLAQELPAVERDEMKPAARASIEHLFSNAHVPAHEFARRYWAHVHTDPHVAMAHAAVKQAVRAWPARELDTTELLAERHHLAEKARHAAKRR